MYHLFDPDQFKLAEYVNPLKALKKLVGAGTKLSFLLAITIMGKKSDYRRLQLTWLTTNPKPNMSNDLRQLLLAKDIADCNSTIITNI